MQEHLVLKIRTKFCFSMVQDLLAQKNAKYRTPSFIEFLCKPIESAKEPFREASILVKSSDMEIEQRWRQFLNINFADESAKLQSMVRESYSNYFVESYIEFLLDTIKESASPFQMVQEVESSLKGSAMKPVPYMWEEFLKKSLDLKLFHRLEDLRNDPQFSRYVEVKVASKDHVKGEDPSAKNYLSYLNLLPQIYALIMKQLYHKFQDPSKEPILLYVCKDFKGYKDLKQERDQKLKLQQEYLQRQQQQQQQNERRNVQPIQPQNPIINKMEDSISQMTQTSQPRGPYFNQMPQTTTQVPPFERQSLPTAMAQHTPQNNGMFSAGNPFPYMASSNPLPGQMVKEQNFTSTQQVNFPLQNQSMLLSQRLPQRQPAAVSFPQPRGEVEQQQRFLPQTMNQVFSPDSKPKQFSKMQFDLQNQMTPQTDSTAHSPESQILQEACSPAQSQNSILPQTPINSYLNNMGESQASNVGFEDNSNWYKTSIMANSVTTPKAQVQVQIQVQQTNIMKEEKEDDENELEDRESLPKAIKKIRTNPAPKQEINLCPVQSKPRSLFAITRVDTEEKILEDYTYFKAQVNSLKKDARFKLEIGSSVCMGCPFMDIIVYRRTCGMINYYYKIKLRVCSKKPTQLTVQEMKNIKQFMAYDKVNMALENGRLKDIVEHWVQFLDDGVKKMDEKVEDFNELFAMESC